MWAVTDPCDLQSRPGQGRGTLAPVCILSPPDCYGSVWCCRLSPLRWYLLRIPSPLTLGSRPVVAEDWLRAGALKHARWFGRPIGSLRTLDSHMSFASGQKEEESGNISLGPIVLAMTRCRGVLLGLKISDMAATWVLGCWGLGIVAGLMISSGSR